MTRENFEKAKEIINTIEQLESDIKTLKMFHNGCIAGFGDFSGVVNFTEKEKLNVIEMKERRIRELEKTLEVL